MNLISTSSKDFSTPRKPYNLHVLGQLARAGRAESSQVIHTTTRYKILNTATGEFCSGGSWPCQWDDAGKVWQSAAAVRRYLQSVARRGYHLKPRELPEYWQIVEIE